MSLTRRSIAFLSAMGALVALAEPASAAGLNNPTCVPTPQRPYPAVVVHGQGGNFEGMTGITDTLVGAGYCVYAENYGHVPGGANGQDHLSSSATQIRDFIAGVLLQTHATQVDVIGHSAGTGVLDNYVLKKGGDALVHRFVSFGGLHHPYAHAGLDKFADASIFLPNLTLAARKIYPLFSVQDVVKIALNTYAAAGSPLGLADPGLAATADSNFTADLFDPLYWKDLHGSLSEVDGDYVSIGQSVRSRLTNDSSPNVCYTNIVAIADLLVGPATGFLDEATNVDNFLLTSSITTNAHVDMISDPNALTEMMSGLNTPCMGGGVKKVDPAPFAGVGGGASGGSGGGTSGAADAFTSAAQDADPNTIPQFDGNGCSMSSRPGSSSSGILAVCAAILAGVRRRRSAPSRG